MTALALLFCLGLAPQDSAEETIAAMQKRADAIGEKIAWRVWTWLKDRNYSTEKGFEVFGRFRRGEGTRSKVNVMGCADESDGHDALPGPNRYSLIYLPTGEVSLQLSLIPMEAKEPDVFPPHVILRDRPGTRDRGAIEPYLLLPQLPVFLYFDTPLMHYAVMPSLLFSLEPGLKTGERKKIEGVECIALRSERRFASAESPPSNWYRPDRVRKTFWIGIEDPVVRRLEMDIHNAGGNGAVESVLLEVLRTQEHAGTTLPARVRLTVPAGGGDLFVLEQEIEIQRGTA